MSRKPENFLDNENFVSAKFQNRILQLINENFCKNNEEFAKLTGVSVPVISKSANYGIVPSVKPLLKIVETLHLSFDYLLAKSDKNEFYPSANPVTFHIRLRQLKTENQNRWSNILFNLPFPRTYIYEWLKKGTYPCVDYLYALAREFHVSADYLLGRTDER